MRTCHRCGQMGRPETWQNFHGKASTDIWQEIRRRPFLHRCPSQKVNKFWRLPPLWRSSIRIHVLSPSYPSNCPEKKQEFSVWAGKRKCVNVLSSTGSLERQAITVPHFHIFPLLNVSKWRACIPYYFLASGHSSALRPITYMGS